MLLEIMEDRFFAGLRMSFVNMLSTLVILDMVDTCQVVGLLILLGNDLTVQESLLVEKLFNGVILEGQMIEKTVILFSILILRVGIDGMKIRHIFWILVICISKHYTLHQTT